MDVRKYDGVSVLVRHCSYCEFHIELCDLFLEEWRFTQGRNKGTEDLEKPSFPVLKLTQFNLSMFA
jgi:hypothetical protein